MGGLGFLISRYAWNDGMGGGRVVRQAHHEREAVGMSMSLLSNAYPCLLLSAEGWVAFGAAGLFVAGEVAYF